MKNLFQKFASDGLRTLLCGIKDLTEDEFQTWKAAHHEAAIALTDREEKLDFVYNEIEKNLQLAGATAIEDKLQVILNLLIVQRRVGMIFFSSLIKYHIKFFIKDGVPQTIQNILTAGIKLWVLTGDKQETAINIGHSCKLLKNDAQIIILNTTSLDETRTEVNEHLLRLQHQNTIGK